MDVLFLHVPKFRNYYKPIGEYSFILYPPVGLLGLADYLRQNRRSTEIIHLGVERQKFGEVDLEKILADRDPNIVGLDLHWHFQCYDVIEVAKRIKKLRPDVAVLLGGFTATVFAEEILKTYDCVDFVIRGESEVPILELHTQYRSGKAYDRVANLAYRDGRTVRLNPVSFLADQPLLDSISFTDFTLMKDYPLFVESFSRYMNLPNLSEAAQKRILRNRKVYPVFLGRGCPNACSYCGGGRESHIAINNRRRVSMRSVDHQPATGRPRRAHVLHHVEPRGNRGRTGGHRPPHGHFDPQIKPEDPVEFKFAEFGDSSNIQVGEYVLAMGSPMALSQSVTLGIISNTEMTMPRFWGGSRSRRRRRDSTACAPRIPVYAGC